MPPKQSILTSGPRKPGGPGGPYDKNEKALVSVSQKEPRHVETHWGDRSPIPLV